MAMQHIKKNRICFLALAITAMASSHVFAAEAETSTMEPGTAQLEFKLGENRNSRDADFTSRVRSTPFLARIGIASNAELRIETAGNVRASATELTTGFTQSVSGTADTSIGARWRPIDADEKRGSPAIAFMLTFGLPTGSRAFKTDGFSTALKVASEWQLGNDASIAVMPGLLREKNAAGNWFVAPSFAITAGKSWTPAWRTTFELVAPRLASSKNGGNEITFNLGNTYTINDRVELEAVYLRGLTNQTDNHAIVFGVNIKF
jgi:hypothetical protein